MWSNVSSLLLFVVYFGCRRYTMNTIAFCPTHVAEFLHNFRLRDALHTQYKSSSKSKAGRRKIPKIGECNDIGKKKLKDVRYEPNIANSNILPGSRDAGNDEKVVMEHATDLLSELPDPMKMLKVSSHNDDRASRRKDNRGPPVCQGDDSDCDQKQSSLSLRGEKGSIESCSFDNQEFEYNGDFDLSDDDCSDQIISSAFWEG